MSKTFDRMPDDLEWFDSIDPALYLWMFYQWVQDQDKQATLARQLAIFIGSFTNPEAAKKIQKADDPDFAMTDDGFDALTEKIEKEAEQEVKVEKIRRRRRIKLNKNSNG